MKKAFFLIMLAFLILYSVCVSIAAAAVSDDQQQQKEQNVPYFAGSLAGGKHPVIMYIPNRIFDILDILRLRVRVGPGLSVGARATELADVFLGAHATGYVGLRGARGTPQIPWPFGPETNAGVEVSVVDTTDSDSRAAAYVDPLEISIQTQLAIVGFYIGFELFEILDLATGFLFIDLQKDDF